MNDGTGLFVEGNEVAQDDIAQLFTVPPDTKQESGAQPESASESSAPNIEFPDFTLFDAPKAGKKKTLGPDDKEELADFFTQDGIGSIVARGFDAFFLACGAEKMTTPEHNNMAKITAYYFRARLPKEAGGYQPELLLFATVAMAVLPRMGPIAEKTAPFWSGLWSKVTSFFGKGKENVE